MGYGTVSALGLSAVFSTALATKSTVKTRKREVQYQKSGGMSGSSRTKANKEVTKAWSKAVAGTATGFAGGAATGALIGQVHFSPLLNHSV